MGQRARLWRPPRPECMDILCTEKKFQSQANCCELSNSVIRASLGTEAESQLWNHWVFWQKPPSWTLRASPVGDGPLPAVPLPVCLCPSVCLSLWSSCLSVSLSFTSVPVLTLSAPLLCLCLVYDPAVSLSCLMHTPVISL